MVCLLDLLLMMVVYNWCTLSDDSTTVRSVSQDSYEPSSTNMEYGMIYDEIMSLLEIEESESNSTGTSVAKARFKRQQSGSSGKFTETAQMPQLKLLRLFLTMFKNLWASTSVGGSHPFSPSVPKATVQLFKNKILEFFFPDVGEKTED